MSVRAGGAFIAISPSFRGFRAKTETFVQSGLRGVKAEVEVELKASKKPLIIAPPKTVKAKVDVDRSALDRGISAVENRLDRLTRGRFIINVGIAMSPTAAPLLAGAAGGLAGLGGIGAGVLGGAGGFAGVAAGSMSRISDQQKSNAQAQAQSAAASRASAASATASAAARVSAARAVERAEEGVRRANMAVKDAQDRVKESLAGLHDARRQAIRDLEDMRERSRDNALSTESAEIGLIEAREALKKVESTAGSSALDLRKAKLAVAEAEDRLSDSRRQSTRDAKELATAEKKGVKGADVVVAARKEVAQAKREEAEARRGVREARKDLGEARAAAATAGQTGAADIAAQTIAFKALTPAQQGAADALDRLKGRWNAFLDTTDPVVLGALGKGMDALGNALKPLVGFITPVAGAMGAMFTAFGDGAASGGFASFMSTFGQFSAGILGDATEGTLHLARALGNLFVAFMPLSTDMSDGLVTMMERFADWSEGLSESAGFASFVDYVQTTGPMILSAFTAIGGALIAVGIAAAPLGAAILEGITKFAEGVSSFAKEHPKITTAAVGFISLSSAVSAMAVPAAKMVGLLRLVYGGTTKTVGAVVGLGKGVAKTTKFGADFIGGLRDQSKSLKKGASLATTYGAAVRQGGANMLRSVKAVGGLMLEQGKLAFAYARTTAAAIWQGTVALASAAKARIIAAATRAWALGQVLLNAAMSANPIMKLVVLLGLIGGAVYLAYTHIDGFREGVQAAWTAIKTAGASAWNDVIKPMFTAMKFYITDVLIPTYKYLWNNIIKPIFGWIGSKIRDVWIGVIRPAFSGMKSYLTNTVFPVYRALWNSVVKPIFGWIGSKISNTWTKVIQPAFSAIKTGVGRVKDAFSSAKDGIKSAWGGVTDVITNPIDKAKGILNSFFKGINGLAKKFGIKWRIPYFDISKPPPKGDGSAGSARNNTGGRGPVSRRAPAQSGGPGGKRPSSRVWPANTKALSGNYAGHSGIDIAAANGSPIKAASAGRIEHAGYGRGYGMAIFNRGTDGSLQIYGHSQRTDVKPGQSVRAGQRLGLVGSTGRSTGPHLHFEIARSAPGSPSNRQASFDWLAGASFSSKGASTAAEFDKVTLFNIADRMRDALRPLPFIGGLGGRIAGWAKDWANPFDSGGLAQSRGLMIKDTVRPERVLSPRQTDAFESAMARSFGAGDEVYEMRMTNWDEGVGLVRRVAKGEAKTAVSDAKFADARDNRMGAPTQ